MFSFISIDNRKCETFIYCLWFMSIRRKEQCVWLLCRIQMMSKKLNEEKMNIWPLPMISHSTNKIDRHEYESIKYVYVLEMISEVKVILRFITTCHWEKWKNIAASYCHFLWWKEKISKFKLISIYMRDV
jgi:hypothetical protein